MGFNGPYALDYTPLFMRMDRLGLSRDEWEDCFQDVRLIERTALEEMAKRKS